MPPLPPLRTSPSLRPSCPSGPRSLFLLAPSLRRSCFQMLITLSLRAAVANMVSTTRIWRSKTASVCSAQPTKLGSWIGIKLWLVLEIFLSFFLVFICVYKVFLSVIHTHLSVGHIGVQAVPNILLPLVDIRQLLFLVQQLLSRLRQVLHIRRLHNRLHRAQFLAVPAVDALGHGNITLGRPSEPVHASIGMAMAGHTASHSFARDTALLSRRVPAQRVLAPKPQTFQMGSRLCTKKLLQDN